MTTAFVHYNTIVLYHRCSCPIFSDLTEDYNSITIRVNHLYNMLCGSDTLKFVLIIDFCTKSETPTMPFPTHRSTFNSVQSAVVYHPHIVNYGMHHRSFAFRCLSNCEGSCEQLPFHSVYQWCSIVSLCYQPSHILHVIPPHFHGHVFFLVHCESRYILFFLSFRKYSLRITGTAIWYLLWSCIHCSSFFIFISCCFKSPYISSILFM